MSLDEKPAAQRALAWALAADIVFIGGMALAWAREFYLFLPVRLANVLIVSGLALAVVAGVKLLLIANGAAGWWRRSGSAFGLALTLSGLPGVVLLAWAVYFHSV